MSDERIKRPVGRPPRAMQDRAVTEDRNLSDSVRKEEFGARFRQGVLPPLPDIPGYHVMWASTTNSRDTIMGRLQEGYEIIKAEDVPGFESMSVKTGEYAGAVAVNEMIALKLPEDRYQAMMRYYHHQLPREEDERRDAILDVVRDNAAKHGLKVAEGEDAEPSF